MTVAGDAPEGELSLFAMGSMILRQRRRLALWSLAGAVAAALSVVAKPAEYRSTATFISSQGTDASRSGLSSLAGQLGVALPSGNQTLSPEFYARLVTARPLLEAVAHDTFVVAEQEGKRVSFTQLFEIPSGSAAARNEKSVKLLGDLISASFSKMTGIIEVNVATKWPSVSQQIAARMLEAVNEFNQGTRREQAVAERKFVEGRLIVVGAALRDAEDRMQRFLKTNRQYAGSPELTFQFDRLQRDLELQQSVYSSLTQSYEEVRIREVRDTPAITVIEPPIVPTMAEPRGRVVRTLLGLLLGAMVGVIVAVLTEAVARHRRNGDADASEFGRLLDESLNDFRTMWSRLSHRSE